MQKPLLHFQYHRLVSQYRKFKFRLDKALKENRFKDFSQQQQRQVLSRLEKLKTRLAGMPHRLKLSGFALALGLALYNGETQAQAPVSVDSEFMVNTQTEGDQNEPAIAMNSNGDFVVAWTGQGQDRYGSSIMTIKAQRFNAEGKAQGSEILVNTTEFGNEATESPSPTVAINSNGDFVIAWQFYNGLNLLKARCFNGAGEAKSGELTVNGDVGNAPEASIAMDKDGGFVIAYTSFAENSKYSGIFVNRYNATGDLQGGVYHVNPSAILVSGAPSIAMDGDGNFVIAWREAVLVNEKPNIQIFAQRFNASTQEQGTKLTVSTNYSGNKTNPSVSMNKGGAFVIAWQSDQEVRGGFGVYARRYNAAGDSQGVEFHVNTFTFNDQQNPSVAMNNDGGFVIAWQSYYQQEGDNSFDGIYAQLYNSSGKMQDTEFLVNTYTLDNQSNPSVSMDSVGGFVVVWDSYNGDSSFKDIMAQRYTSSFTLGTSPDASISNNQINVYPNPSTGAFTINTSGVLLDEFNITIIDALGATVYKGIFTEQLSLDHLPKGLYNLKMENEKESIVKQIVIQ